MRAILAVGIVACLVALPKSGGEMPAGRVDAVTQQRVSVSGPSPAFNVDLVHGSVTVAAHDEPFVEYTITRTTTAATDEDREAAEREVALDIAESDAGVSMCASLPYRERCDEPMRWMRDARPPTYRVTFDVVAKVPRATRVVARTVDGRAIRVSDLDGPVELRHVNGGIEAAGLVNGGSLKTVNGDVRITLAQNPRAPLVVETVNGAVVAQFARGLSADFWIASMFGRVFSEFDVTRLPPVAPVADRSDGHLRYRFDRAFGIRVGQGGPAHRFTTLNGDISIVARGQ